jgi:hypothetical protein
MRDLRLLDIYRRTDAPVVAMYGDDGDETCGVFMLPPTEVSDKLMVIASSGEGWDHVSVSAERRCPTWKEMEFVRRLFFRREEAAMQYHAPVEDYVDGTQHGCEHCLHLWRPHDVPIPAAAEVDGRRDDPGGGARGAGAG